ncbi:hypothetical protein BN10_520039 [Phycicoccus elongatus Lp2]|uniref:Uncharacterized protein n=1 Tax=Phycicoccus elongatus Lp2 TaxID=1193181 RepID=N0DZS1_9MICO|nr:hypothetical protein BN10_520039 [Phycicoccus elongatus Lp2]
MDPRVGHPRTTLWPASAGTRRGDPPTRPREQRGGRDGDRDHPWANGHGQGCLAARRHPGPRRSHRCAVRLGGYRRGPRQRRGRPRGRPERRRHRPDPPAGCHTAARCPPRGLDDLGLTASLTGAVRRSEADLVRRDSENERNLLGHHIADQGGDLGLAASACLDGTTVDHDPSLGTSPDEPTQAGGPDLPRGGIVRGDLLDRERDVTVSAAQPGAGTLGRGEHQVVEAVTTGGHRRDRWPRQGATQAPSATVPGRSTPASR